MQSATQSPELDLALQAGCCPHQARASSGTGRTGYHLDHWSERNASVAPVGEHCGVAIFDSHDPQSTEAGCPFWHAGPKGQLAPRFVAGPARGPGLAAGPLAYATGSARRPVPASVEDLYPARAQRRLKLRRLVACVGNAPPLADRSTLQPTRQPIHTAEAIHGTANNTPSAKPMRSARIVTKVSVAEGRMQEPTPEAATGQAGRVRMVPHVGAPFDA